MQTLVTFAIEEEARPVHDRNAAIDLFVATEWQGRGLDTEALRVLARYLFDERVPGGTWHDGLLMDLLTEDLR